jgi:hypothetical protein
MAERMEGVESNVTAAVERVSYRIFGVEPDWTLFNIKFEADDFLLQ